MKAITTRFFPSTNHRPARIIAQDQDRNTFTATYQYDSHVWEHRQAALALCSKMRWEGKLIGGSLGNGKYAWVFSTSDLGFEHGR